VQIGLNSSNLSGGSIRRIIGKQSEVTILDIGANVGEFSKLCRENYKSARIFAIEPQVQCHKEILQNSGPDTIVIGKLVSSITGFATFSISKNKDRKAHIVNNSANYNQSSISTFEKTTVDEIISNYELNHINLLKIDAEGHDFEVLRGAELALTNGLIENILFEVMPRLIESNTLPSDIERYLKQFGFEFFYRSTPNLGLMLLDQLFDYELHTQNILVRKQPIRHKQNVVIQKRD